VLNVEANLKYPYNRAEVINLHLPWSNVVE
jgi:hypothetical protein